MIVRAEQEKISPTLNGLNEGTNSRAVRDSVVENKLVASLIPR